MADEERDTRIEEIEANAEKVYSATRDDRVKQLVEDSAWLVEQLSAVRDETIQAAVAVVNQCREDELTDLREVRARIEALGQA